MDFTAAPIASRGRLGRFVVLAMRRCCPGLAADVNGGQFQNHALPERATCDSVIEWCGRGCKTVYPGLKRLLRRAGLGDCRIHDLRRSSATFVYHGLGGNLTAAANHIGDSEKMADAVYVQRNAEVNLPGIRAVSAVIANARKAG